MATKQILVSLEVSGDISDEVDNTIYDHDNSHIPDSILQKTWGDDRDANGKNIKDLGNMSYEGIDGGSPALDLGRLIYNTIDGGMPIPDFVAGKRIDGGQVIN